MRLIIGAVTLWCIARRLPDMAALRANSKLFVVGGVSVAAYQPGFFIGTERSGVALGTIVALGSGPIFAGVLEWVWHRRTPKMGWVLATATMMLGGVLLVFGRSAGSTFSLLGTVGSLSAGFAYALFAIITKRLIEAGVASTTAVAWQFTIGAMLLAVAFVHEPVGWIATGAGALMVLHLGVLATGVAYLLYGIALRSVSSSTAVTMTLVEPVTAAIFAVVILDERLQPFGWVGVLVVFIGFLWAARLASE